MSNKPNDDLREIKPEGVTKFGPGTITGGGSGGAPTPKIPGFGGPGI